MALTLTANITPSARVFRVTGTVPADVLPGYTFRFDDELLELTGFGTQEVQGPVSRNVVPDRNLWRVLRGQGPSTAASHTAGATVRATTDAFASSSGETPPTPFPSGGAGAVDSVNGQTGAVELTSEDIAVASPLTGTVQSNLETALEGGVLHGDGPPFGGTNMDFSVAGAGNSEGTYKLTFGPTDDPTAYTTAAIAWDADGDAIAAAMNLAADDIIARAYPTYGSVAPNDTTYPQFIGALGGQDIPVPTVTDDTTDGGIVAAEDQVGEAPTPAATNGTQYVDDLTELLYTYRTQPLPTGGILGWMTGDLQYGADPSLPGIPRIVIYTSDATTNVQWMAHPSDPSTGDGLSHSGAALCVVLSGSALRLFRTTGNGPTDWAEFADA